MLVRCRAKKGTGSKLAAPPVTFRDVAGLDTAKEELLEVVACLRDARRYARLNAKTPSGVLLTGPPGTGKTLLGESQPFASLSRMPLQVICASMSDFPVMRRGMSDSNYACWGLIHAAFKDRRLWHACNLVAGPVQGRCPMCRVGKGWQSFSFTNFFRPLKCFLLKTHQQVCHLHALAFFLVLRAADC